MIKTITTAISINPKRLAFWIVLLVTGGNIFYYPKNYVDCFFTSGMLWTSITTGFIGILFPFIARKHIKLPSLTLGSLILLVAVIIEKSTEQTFPWQTTIWECALWLLFIIVGHFSSWGTPNDWYGGLSVLGVIESIIGIGQCMGICPIYQTSSPITGTFENPAGLAACLTICFPATLYFFISTSVGSKIWGSFSMILIFGTIILSCSRTGIITIGILAIIVACRSFFPRHRIASWTKITFILLGITLLVGLYFWKKDSADGRLLIWKCSLNMCSDAIWTGHGKDAFQAKYMDYQAEWLTRHPEKKWEQIADNVKHPFNEYLRIIVEYGIIGLLFIGGWIWLLVRKYRHCQTEDRPLFWSIGGICICALFSYPLNYPAICSLLALILGILMRQHSGWQNNNCNIKGYISVLSIIVFIVSIYWHQVECQWYRISHLALTGKTTEVLSDYARLYSSMHENPLFLYNYAAELHIASDWAESIKILTECSQKMNDTDVQILLAENYKHLNEYTQAEYHYLHAAQMCPNRFVPLYHLVILYEQTGRTTEARTLAAQIIMKPIKVPSSIIDKIKYKMEQYLQNKI